MRKSICGADCENCPTSEDKNACLRCSNALGIVGAPAPVLPDGRQVQARSKTAL